MRILVIYFTQSGQQEHIVRTLTKPFTDAGDHVHFEGIKPVESFPFPWSAFSFFNAFPETFTQQPYALQPLSAKAFETYDLVVLGYQPWFLTPSRPISSFLQSADAAKILHGKPVVTILGSRNMWLGAQEKVKKWLIKAGANLVGHIALVDNSGNLTSLVTILRWMLWGKKDAFWFFPPAGVAQKDIEHTAVFGSLIRSAASNQNFDNLQSELNAQGAILVKPNLVLMEKRGQRGFGFYSKFILAGGPVGSPGRKRRVYIFMNVLPTAIVLLSPLLFVMSKVLLIAKRKQLKEEVEYHMQNSLRG
jgi:hypothetical protein